MVGRQTDQHQPDDGIDEAEKEDVGAVCAGVIEPPQEHVFQIADADPADHRLRRLCSGNRLRHGLRRGARVHDLINGPFGRISDMESRSHFRFSRTLGSGDREPHADASRVGHEKSATRL